MGYGVVASILIFYRCPIRGDFGAKRVGSRAGVEPCRNDAVTSIRLFLFLSSAVRREPFAPVD
jgi:hypothetical protein